MHIVYSQRLLYLDFCLWCLGDRFSCIQLSEGYGWSQPNWGHLKWCLSIRSAISPSTILTFTYGMIVPFSCTQTCHMSQRGQQWIWTTEYFQRWLCDTEKIICSLYCLMWIKEACVPWMYALTLKQTVDCLKCTCNFSRAIFTMKVSTSPVTALRRSVYQLLLQMNSGLRCVSKVNLNN